MTAINNHSAAGLELHDHLVTAVLVDARGEVIGREEHAGGNDFVAAALAALESVTRSAGAGSLPIGIASPTPDVAAHAGVTAAVTKHFPGNARLVGRVLPSGTAAVAAEEWVGAARGAADIVYFAAGDRATAGILLRGKPWPGAHGRAADAAWLALNPVERDDYRRHGCLEAEAASAGIVRRLVWRIKAGDHSRVQDAAGGDLGAITIDMVLDAARGGDGVAISVMRDTAKYLGMAAANLVAIVDPEMLVLGGIMASAADLLLEPVRGEIVRRLPPASVESIRIVPATLGRDAAAIGAARLAAAATP